MDILKVKHDLNGGFDSVLMAMKLIKPDLSDPELVSLMELSMDKVKELKSLSTELVNHIELSPKTQS